MPKKVDVSLGHDEHAHTLSSTTGCTGTFNTGLTSGHGAEANTFTVLGVSYTDSVKPVVDAGVVDLIDGDHEIGDGVRIVATPGHTAGHHCLAINSKGKRAMLSGDILQVVPSRHVSSEFVAFFCSA